MVCVAPGSAKAQELDLRRGTPHQAIARDDTYPNQIFHRDYTVIGPVTFGDPLAVTLRDFWARLGYNDAALREAWLQYLGTFKKKKPPWWRAVRQAVEGGSLFFEARKDQPAVVRGVVDVRMTTSEGPITLQNGAVLLQHPDDPSNQWVVEARRFAARYDWVRAPRSGLLIPRNAQGH